MCARPVVRSCRVAGVAASATRRCHQSQARQRAGPDAAAGAARCAAGLRQSRSGHRRGRAVRAALQRRASREPGTVRSRRSRARAAYPRRSAPTDSRHRAPRIVGDRRRPRGRAKRPARRRRRAAHRQRLAERALAPSPRPARHRVDRETRGLAAGARSTSPGSRHRDAARRERRVSRPLRAVLRAARVHAEDSRGAQPRHRRADRRRRLYPASRAAVSLPPRAARTGSRASAGRGHSRSHGADRRNLRGVDSRSAAAVALGPLAMEDAPRRHRGTLRPRGARARVCAVHGGADDSGQPSDALAWPGSRPWS